MRLADVVKVHVGIGVFGIWDSCVCAFITHFSVFLCALWVGRS